MKKYTQFQNIALVILRLILAVIFFYAGYAKLSFWTNAPQGMSSVMIYLMKFLSIVEPLGALALVIGFLTRWAAAGLATIMAGAFFLMWLGMHVGFFTSPQGSGLDYLVTIFCASIAVVAFGAGKWSVDSFRK